MKKLKKIIFNPMAKSGAVLGLIVGICGSHDNHHLNYFAWGCIITIIIPGIASIVKIIKTHISLSTVEIASIVKSSLTKKMQYKLIVSKPLIFLLSFAFCIVAFLVHNTYISHLLSLGSITLYCVCSFYMEWEYKVGLCHIIDQNTGELLEY